MKKSLLKKVWYGFLVLLAVNTVALIAMAIFGDHQPTPKKNPTLNSIAAGCQVEWERAMKSKLKDPDSLDWDVRSAELGMLKDKPVISVPYRARNSFNGLALEKAICHIDPATGDVKAVLR